MPKNPLHCNIAYFHVEKVESIYSFPVYMFMPLGECFVRRPVRHMLIDIEHALMSFGLWPLYIGIYATSRRNFNPTRIILNSICIIRNVTFIGNIFIFFRNKRASNVKIKWKICLNSEYYVILMY